MKILGISCYYHDSAAVLIDKGEIIAAAEEERFSRIKHDFNFPERAIEFCLREGRVTAENIDWVVFYEKPFVKFERILLSCLASVPKGREMFVGAMRVWLRDKLWIRSTLAKRLKIPTKKIVFCTHHLSHAASAYYTSTFKSAALLTCDGVGEWTTTAWGKATNNKIFLNEEIKFPHSLGLFYSTFTQFLGFQVNEGEFKVMGLAPYGKPKFVSKVNKLIKQSADGSFQLDLKYFNFHISDKVSFNQKFIDLFGVPPVNPKKSDEVVQVYADIAASAQAVLDDKLLRIARFIKEKTGEENLCYSGGVALNGVTNWKIFKDAGFKNIFIHPAAGDSGGALGAALYLYFHVFDKKKPKKSIFITPYLGDENGNDDINKFLNENSIKATYMNDREMNKEVVSMLVNKKVIGWVKGRFEWGPRALGARSILADPRDKKMKDLVNSKIKFREAFRPFAPVCLYEKARDYFEVGNDYVQQPLQYMIAVVPVKKEKRKSLGAITHVDGTARPQFIRREVNKNYYDVIKAFGDTTGTYVLLNTSFNLKGEPIVNKAGEAYDTFMRSGLDALVLGNYLIKK